MIPPVRSKEKAAIKGVVRVAIPLGWKELDGETKEVRHKRLEKSLCFGVGYSEF